MRQIKPQLIPRHDYNSCVPLQCLPFDLYLEIGGCFSVLDLQALSRCCKALDRVVLSKRFRPVWQSALRSVDAASMLQDMNEPQFVELVFGYQCYECGENADWKIDYGLRIRLCRNCSSSKMSTGNELISKSQSGKHARRALRLCYFEGASRLKGRDRFKNVKLAKRLFYAPDFEKVAGQCSLLSPDSAEFKEFVKGRKKIVNSICRQVSEIHKWLAKLRGKEIPLGPPKDILKTYLRMKSVQHGLRDIGHPFIDLSHLVALKDEWAPLKEEWKKLCVQPHDLTLSDWHRISPKLKALSTQAHLLKSSSLWMSVWSVYFRFPRAWNEEHGHCPSIIFGEVQSIPDICSLVSKAGLRGTLTALERAKIRKLLAQSNSAIEDGIKAKCFDAIIHARQSIGMDVDAPAEDLLNHASTFFIDAKKPFPVKMETFETVAYRRTFSRWVPGTSSLSTKPIEIGLALIRSLGLPETVTMTSMEQFGRRFVCKICNPYPAERMHWNELVQHFLHEMNWYEGMSKVLCDDQRVKIFDSHNVSLIINLAAMEDEADTRHRVRDARFFCSTCNTLAPSRELVMHGCLGLVQAHVRLSHGKAIVKTEDIMLQLEHEQAWAC